jgi:glyoxylase-like metal-dependent hydrolase (beta-lactamase superfamily II)
VVVIDALGTPSLGRELIKAIRRVTQQPVRRVIVTHYHADHIYGLQAFKEAGAEIWAHRGAQAYIETEAEARLAQRRRELAPWVNADTRVVPADRWLDGNTTFTLGGLTFDLTHLGPAHTPEDVVVAVREEQLIFSGDIIFTGRIPFVGEADSKQWLAAMDRLLAFKPRIMVTGHGKVSSDPASDLTLTRDYLLYLRETMGKAVEHFVPFEDAYRKTDWSRFSHLPAFEAANRVNAYGTYLLMERESLKKQP